MKVLFITSTRIGDAVLSTALLSHLSKTHPEAKFTIACGPLAAPLFSATPNVVRVIALQKRRASLHWFGLWQACCGTWWDLVVDLRASAISYFLMTRRRMVWRRDDRAVHRVNSLAELAGLSETPVPHLSTGTQHRDAADKLLGAARPVLVLGPTARRLTAPDGILPGARIAILGAASERDDAAPVVAALPADRVIDLVGKLDLLTAAALLERSDMYIGNDSGLMHIAAAAGVPTLGLFGPSKEAHYAPWGARTAVVRTALDYDELVGGPGYDHRTTGSLMESLSVDMAADAARRLWAEGT